MTRSFFSENVWVGLAMVSSEMEFPIGDRFIFSAVQEKKISDKRV